MGPELQTDGIRTGTTSWYDAVAEKHATTQARLRRQIEEADEPEEFI